MNADDELKQALRRNHLFADLSEEQLARILHSTQKIHLDEGAHLFEYQDEAERFFLLLQGQIKLFRITPAGTDKIVEIVSAGQTFAEAIMFMDAKAYPVAADALSTTEVVAIDNKAFMAVLRESGDTCFRLMGTMSMRLRQLLGEIDALTMQNAKLRFIHYLLGSVPPSVRGGQPVTVELEVPKAVIASRLSMQPESLSRILHQLSTAGLITVDSNTIHINDVDTLRAFENRVS
ncbi:MAG: Crp/Fnr family transcriptional regulator [Pseudomonadota bacterium]|nr:MAG: Crp/Fnr family transcriptional regulator [Pseudomonadota bacterium]